jgi:hypothetical protein
VARALQQDSTAQRPGQSPTGTRSYLAKVADRLRSATRLVHLGAGTRHELTSTPDHFSQAVQAANSRRSTGSASRSSRSCSSERRTGSSRCPTDRRSPRHFVGVNVIRNKHWTIFTNFIFGNINSFSSQILKGSPLSRESKAFKFGERGVEFSIYNN